MTTWFPISDIFIQYQNPSTNAPYSGAVLKAYRAGTSTVINMATDATGATTMTSVALNASGFPAVSGNVVIPHVAEDYKLALYPNQAAADSNTGAVVGPIDNFSITENPVLTTDTEQGYSRLLADVLKNIEQRTFTTEVPYYDPSTSVARTISSGSSLNKHQHFGGITRTVTGRLIAVWRENDAHTVSSGSRNVITKSDNEGRDWSALATLNPSVANRDIRECLIGSSHLGHVYVAYNDIADDNDDVNSGNPQLFKLRVSTDNGDTFGDDIIIDQISKSYARLFGSIKVVPSDQTAGEYMLVVTGYFNDDDVNYSTGYYKSYDLDGSGAWTWVPVVSNTTGHTEGDVCFLNDGTIIYVVRGTASGDGLTCFVSTDRGASFTNKGSILANYVAPSLDLFYYNSMPFLLLGYCDRSADYSEWRIAPANNVVGSLGIDGFAKQFNTGANDMVNASGYQRVVVYPTGHILFIEFKEYLTPTAYSDVRIWQANPGRWCDRYIDGDILLGGSKYDTGALLNITVGGDDLPAVESNAASGTVRRHYNFSVAGTPVGFLGTETDYAGIGSYANAALSAKVHEPTGNMYYTYKHFFGNFDPASLPTQEGAANFLTASSTVRGSVHYSGTTSSRTQAAFENPNGLVGSISTSGTTTTFNTTSDPRLKSCFEMVTPEETFAKINILASCIGKFHYLKDAGQEKHIGFNAHKVLDAKVIPTMACEGEGGRDAIVDNVTVTPAQVDHSKAVPIMIAAIDILRKQNAELENRLKALESK